MEIYIFWCRSLYLKIKIVVLVAPLLPHGGRAPQAEEPRKEALLPTQEEAALLHHTWNRAHSAHRPPPWKGKICHFIWSECTPRAKWPRRRLLKVIGIGYQRATKALIIQEQTWEPGICIKAWIIIQHLQWGKIKGVFYYQKRMFSYDFFSLKFK